MSEYYLKNSNGLQSLVFNSSENVIKLLNIWKEDLFESNQFSLRRGSHIRLVEVLPEGVIENGIKQIEKILNIWEVTEIDHKLVWVEKKIEELDTVFRISNTLLKDRETLFEVVEFPQLPKESRYTDYIAEDGSVRTIHSFFNHIDEDGHCFWQLEMFTNNIILVEESLNKLWAKRVKTTKVLIEKVNEFINKVRDKDRVFMNLLQVQSTFIARYAHSNFDTTSNFVNFQFEVNPHFEEVFSQVSAAMIIPRDSSQEDYEENQVNVYWKESLHASYHLESVIHMTEAEIEEGFKLVKTPTKGNFFKIDYLVARTHLERLLPSKCPNFLTQYRAFILESLLIFLNSLEEELAILEKGYSDGYVKQFFK